MNPSFFIFAIISAIQCLLTPVYAGDEPLPVIREDHELRASDLGPRETFAHTVAVDGDYALVGSAVYGDDGFIESIFAYLFDAHTGQELFKLIPETKDVDGRNLRPTLAVEGNYAVIGTPSEDDGVRDTGAVYVFDINTGQQLYRLVQDSINERFVTYFGMAVAIDKGVLAVASYHDPREGAYSGSVRLYELSTGNELSRIYPEDNMLYYEPAIDFKDGIIAVGTITAETDGKKIGAAYLFDAIKGTQIAKIVPEDDENYVAFGAEVGLDQDLLVVRSENRDFYSPDKLTFYDATTGAPSTKVFPRNNDLILPDWTGIAMDNGLLAVLARGVNDSFEQSVLLFDLQNMEHIATLQSYKNFANSYPNFSLAMKGHNIAVGVPYSILDNNEYSSAYLFDLSCPADLNNDDELDSLDIESFLSDYTKAQPPADLNNDGQYDFLDISAFLKIYSNGCE